MQIFIKYNGTKTLDVEEQDTIEDVRIKLIEKLHLPQSALFRFIYSGKIVPDKTSLKDCGISKEATIHAFALASATSVLDEDVLNELRENLDSLVGNLDENQYLFIGVGSFDNGHGSASIKRQQCPDAVLRICKKYRWDLTVLLIDPGFTPEAEHEQIYDIDTQGWASMPCASSQSGKIRVYKNTMATYINPNQKAHALHDCRVVTFATGVPEYDLINSINNRYEIAEVPFYKMVKTQLFRKKLENVCIVSGNFYAEKPSKTQYFSIGNLAALAASGIPYNP